MLRNQVLHTNHKDMLCIKIYLYGIHRENRIADMQLGFALYTQGVRSPQTTEPRSKEGKIRSISKVVSQQGNPLVFV